MNHLLNLLLVIIGGGGFGLFCTHEIVSLKKINLSKCLKNICIISGMLGTLMMFIGFLGIMIASNNKIAKIERLKDRAIYEDLIETDCIINESLLNEIKEFNEKIKICNENWDNLWVGCYYGEYNDIEPLDYNEALESYKRHIH